MKTSLLFVILAAIIMSNVQAYSAGHELYQGSVANGQKTSTPLSNPIPVWKKFEAMSDDQKANCHIKLSLKAQASDAALKTANSIENLWNSGQFNRALGLFNELSKQTDIRELIFNCSWKVPVPTQQTTLWGTDVRIGNQDSLSQVAFDIHRASGNLFAVLVRNTPGSGEYIVCLSADSGSTWAETAHAWVGININSLGAMVLLNHLYVAFSSGANQTEADIYCYRADNGNLDTFSNGQNRVIIFTTVAPEYIKELSLESNQEILNNRLYVSAITSERNLHTYWANADPVTWNDISPGITNADRGLDQTTNANHDSLYLFVSYISHDDTVRVYGRSLAAWHSYMRMISGAFTDYSAISAYGDTVMCIYDYLYPPNNYTIRYQISRNGGQTWDSGYTDSISVSSIAANVTAKLGAGLGIAYSFAYQGHERFKHRGYRSGFWSPPVDFEDHIASGLKASIEFLGDGVYGVAYIGNLYPISGGAFFNRGTPVCGYTPGDINGNGSVNGVDIVFAVNYLKGGPQPPIDCGNICTEISPFYAAGDVNGNCAFNGIDITFFVRYLKLQVPALLYCVDCSPAQ